MASWYLKFVIVFLVSNGPSLGQKIKREWIPNINYNNPQSWESGSVACPQDTIVFPENFDAALTLPESLLIDSIVLPSNGYLLMEVDAVIKLRTDTSPKESCRDNRKEVVKFKKPYAEPWFLSKNWKVTEGRMDLNDNPAVPHQELIPCNSDVTVFPEENSVLTDLQDAPNILLKDIFVNGRSDLHGFVAFSNTPLGMTMFKNSERTYLQMHRCYSNDPLDCSCHSAVEKYLLVDLLCENEKKFCKVPLCLAPIKPEGHCCDICGATLVLSVPNVHDIRVIVNEFIDDNIEYREKLHTHLSSVIDGENSKHRVQIVAVDKGEYNELSTKFIQDLNSTVNGRYSAGTILQGKYAGSPYNPGSYNFWNVVFACLCITLTFFSIMYVYYEKPEYIPSHLINWRPFFRFNDYRIFSTPFVFARFDNSRDGGEYENITVGIETAATSVADLREATAFSNPIFGEAAREALEKEVPQYEEPRTINLMESVSYAKGASSASADGDGTVDSDKASFEEISIETIA